MPFLTPTDRQRRIVQFSQDWGVDVPPASAPLARPRDRPSFWTAKDDQTAEELLHRRAAELAQSQKKSSLSKAFSSNNLKKGKAWDAREILEVLSAWIANGGTPGVVEALISKLAAAGVEFNGSQTKQKTGILNRRKSGETFVDRAKYLKLAVQGVQYDTLQVLLPHADPYSIDQALSPAIRGGHLRITELLLRYGACASQTPEGQDAFRRACANPTQSQLITLLLRAETRPSAEWTSACMSDAAKSACLETVISLSKSTADGNYKGAEGLKAAVAMGRRDIALAIINGDRPPQGDCVTESFQVLADHEPLDPSIHLSLTELLLCAGAQGEVVSRALERACKTRFRDMVNLLVAYGASVEYEDAAVLKTAIARSELDLVSSLLSETVKLNSALASSCVPCIQKQAPFGHRAAILDLLLRKGASGVALDNMLIEAAEAGDIDSVNLLLSPVFPELTASTLPTRRNHSRSSSLSPRHEVASVDHKSGEALRTSVLRGDTVMTDRILSSHPSAETLSAVFPLTKKLPFKGRHQMVQLFLKRSLPGPCLHAALHDAISQDASQRDNAMIKLLLDHSADINFGQGPGLAGVIQQKDVALLQSLLSKASPQTAAARIPDAMNVPDQNERYEIMSMLISAGAVIGAQQLASALLQTLSERAVDVALMRLLLQQGGTDINLLDGAIAKKAVSNPDPKILDEVFGHGKPSATTTACALNELAPLPSTDSKAWKLRTILSSSNQKPDLDWILVHEVQSLLETSNVKSSLATLQILLDSGANPNAFKAAALCHGVIGSNPKIKDMLFASQVKLTAASLGAALPHALQLQDPKHRLALAKRLVDAGAHPLEVNRALIHAISTYPHDALLQGMLATAADTSDGEALSLCVSKESPETMDLLLAKSSSSMAMRASVLGKVMEARDRRARYQMCESLLKIGVSKDVASATLLIAARDGDVKLGDLLIAHGASITTNNGKAVIEACRGGSAELLSILLKQNGYISESTLEAGFQAATELRDLGKRALVFEQLLGKGIKGELVDAQLQTAARYGLDGQAIMKVLLAAGADANYNDGESVVAATRSAFISNLELLLGLWAEGGAQKRVAQPTLVRSLKACWSLGRDSRFTILSDLFKAGLEVSEELHMALNDAVNESDPEDRLVRLLLDHGASPAANGCKTLVDAVNNSASTSLALLLKKDLPQQDINQAFNDAFTADTFDRWFTKSGLDTARVLLNKGASGDAISGALVLAMERSTPDTEELTDQFVALLADHGADVNYHNGEPLQQAASKANASWTKRLLECRPTIETLSSAFQCIFDAVRSPEEALDLFAMFAEYRDGDVHIDIVSGQQGSEPVLVRAISQFPRSTKILETLLDAGLYQDQATTYKIHDNVDAEEMTLLLWAIAQPQKRVSNGVIELLLTRGVNVNSETSLSRTTPLMLAIQTRRPDLVKLLLLEGADVDVLDYQGRTPLAMATHIGGEISVQMVTFILAADPARDDGSLHNAARDLNLPVVKVLVQAGHDPDFPSPLHEGRSALAETCLHGSDETGMSVERERTMQKVMTLLIDAKSDLSIKSDEKTLLQLCFEAADPIASTRCFLKSGMWKSINRPFTFHIADGLIYSPTMYIKKLMPDTNLADSLLKILKANRAHDVYYSLSGAQPEDAVGLPEDMAIEERARRARLHRLAEETEDFSIAMARKREIASVEQQILTQKSEMEDMRRRKLHNEDVAAVRSRAQLEESLAAAAHARRLEEHHTLAESTIGRSRVMAATELEAEEARHRKALEWETKLNSERVDNARALSSIRVSERQEVERLDKGAESRIKGRLDAQRKLVESQEKLAKRLADGPGAAAVVGMNDPRRQIGYVTELG